MTALASAVSRVVKRFRASEHRHRCEVNFILAEKVANRSWFAWRDTFDDRVQMPILPIGDSEDGDAVLDAPIEMELDARHDVGAQGSRLYDHSWQIRLAVVSQSVHHACISIIEIRRNEPELGMAQPPTEQVEHWRHQDRECARYAPVHSEQLKLRGACRCYLGGYSALQRRRGSIHRFDQFDVAMREMSSNQRHVFFPPLRAVERSLFLFQLFDRFAV